MFILNALVAFMKLSKYFLKFALLQSDENNLFHKT